MELREGQSVPFQGGESVLHVPGTRDVVQEDAEGSDGG